MSWGGTGRGHGRVQVNSISYDGFEPLYTLHTHEYGHANIINIYGLLKDLQIAAFLHGVQETYSQWAFKKPFTIRGKGTDDSLPTVDDLKPQT